MSRISEHDKKKLDPRDVAMFQAGALKAAWRILIDLTNPGQYLPTAADHQHIQTICRELGERIQIIKKRARPRPDRPALVRYWHDCIHYHAKPDDCDLCFIACRCPECPEFKSADKSEPQEAPE